MTTDDVTTRPVLIQGGMGVGVSSWQLANAVARAGQLGVVSGTALDASVARRLQDGDPGGYLRRALAHFPLPALAERVVAKYHRPQGRHGAPYLPVPRLAIHSGPNGTARTHSERHSDELGVVANFVEVWLAKYGHHPIPEDPRRDLLGPDAAASGLVGVNYLEKLQMATPAAAYGAVLGGVDYVLMGAGIPRELPRLLTELAAGRPGTIHVDVAGGSAMPQTLDPTSLPAEGELLPATRRPRFLAIVSSHVLAQFLARDPATIPDGFVVEGPTAGGHSAPPRGQMELDDHGQPVYGPRDEANLAMLAKIGLPFWLAGGYGEPEKVAEALAAGAAGVQVGTLFALARESGLDDDLRGTLLTRLRDESLVVLNSAGASPTGFPFKVAQLPGTLADPEVYAARPRLCDLGYLRTPYVRGESAIGYRCPAEPLDVFARKGGDAAGAQGSNCLCNALMADVGLAQDRKDGYTEAPLVTLGSDLTGARRLDREYLARHDGHRPGGWSAAEAVQWLLGDRGPSVEPTGN
ncbi:MAG: nitronate monooxygenase [Kineosporiaceae bacterium]|nr:nitronate monooxygenase [Kineosporiaceae bacterium]